ncbi:hypothetical protein DL98DRAFT_437980, partial [Cadophora sp. DSE1049]
TPLYYAVREGHVVAVESLVKLGANKDAPDNDGRTPLNYARGTSYEAIAKALPPKT